MSVVLTADLVEAFGGTFLSPRYDQPRPTPELHRAGWRLYTSASPRCLFIAPRDHAKSTALTFVYVLAEVLFRSSDYVIIISSTEEMAQEQLSNIAEELRDNEDLRREFGVDHFETEQKTELIVQMTDGHRFRILARGGEQKIRGRLWKGKRPNLIVCDDMEDDEQVENKDRRRKFRNWFFRAAVQALSQSGKIRVHGTILHDDSLLSRLREQESWTHLFYKAHNSFDDFGGLLWPERWPESKLRQRRQEFIDDGDAAGYSQEFLNTPLDNAEAYLRKDDFLPMRDEDYEAPQRVCAAADFALSKADMANRTSFTVGGKSLENAILFRDQYVGRWSPDEWIDWMFTIQRKWKPELFWVEGGQIWKSVEGFVYKQMRERDIWINIVVVQPVKDKAARGRAYQARHRAGACRFDKKAQWYEDFEYENLRFTGYSQSVLDDQFDSAALLVKGFETLENTAQDDFWTEEDVEMERGFWNRGGARNESDGRSVVTGY